MPQEPAYITQEGLGKLKAELAELQNVRRPQIATRIQEARELETSGTDGEYDDAKNEQAFVEGRILTLENILKNAKIVSAEHPHGRVALGSTVKVHTKDGEESYTIVGSTEADPLHGRISNASPVGKALLGRRVGDEIKVATPSGSYKIKIVRIK